jgi:hypothetical protein
MREKERANKSEKRKLSRRAIPGGESRVATGGELHQTAGGAHPSLTTSQGVALSDNQNSLKANPQGPALLEDFILRDKITHFDHERIPERIVHARGTGIITILLLSMGTGMVLGGALKVLGEGLGIGGKAVAAGVGDLGQEGVKRGADQLGSFIDQAVQSAPTNAAPKDITRAKREIGFAVAKLFAPDSDAASQDNRTAVTKALTSYAGMSAGDATKTVDEWTASYKNLKAELDNLKKQAEVKAREAADRAASNLSSAAIWSFFALLIGLLVTSFGGSCGAKYALRHADSQRLTIK